MTHIVRLVLERAGWYEDKDNDGQFPAPFAASITIDEPKAVASRRPAAVGL